MARRKTFKGEAGKDAAVARRAAAAGGAVRGACGGAEIARRRTSGARWCRSVCHVVAKSANCVVRVGTRVVHVSLVVAGVSAHRADERSRCPWRGSLHDKRREPGKVSGGETERGLPRQLHVPAWGHTFARRDGAEQHAGEAVQTLLIEVEQAHAVPGLERGGVQRATLRVGEANGGLEQVVSGLRHRGKLQRWALRQG